MSTGRGSGGSALWPRLSVLPAKDLVVAQKLEVSEPALAMIDVSATPRLWIERLMGAGLWEDAILVFAAALPKREAIWWGSLCLAPEFGDEETKPGTPRAALRAAKRWAARPEEPRRRAAFAAAEAAGMNHPASQLAFAAFVAEGSLAPPDVAAVPPAPHLSALLVGNALRLAAVKDNPVEAPQKLQSYLNLAIDVAQGRQSWPEDENAK